MTTSDLDKEMREAEWYHSIQVPKSHWMIIRVDGRGFTKLTRSLDLDKPFDEHFSLWMQEVTLKLLEAFDGVYAYTQSDEISILLDPDFHLFNRSLEKLVSISAGIASSRFSMECEEEAHFDSRIWVGNDYREVIKYFRWRQEDSARNALNSWVYYTLRDVGNSRRAATSRMKGMTRKTKHDILMINGINFNELPLWQRRGVGAWWIFTMKDGWNPIIQESVLTTRRRTTVDRELPMRDEYEEFLLGLIKEIAR